MKTIEHDTPEAPPAREAQGHAGKVCYVRPVLAREVRDEIEREADRDVAFSDDAILYALHAADGARIALMSDRAIAFAAARQHEMTPVSLH